MKKAAILVFLAALSAGGASAEAGARSGHGHRYDRGPHGRTVYSVYRSPRFVPPPEYTRPFFFEFFPTNRVNTHQY